MLLTLLTGCIALTFAGQLARRTGLALLRRHLILLAIFTASVAEFYVFAYARINAGQPAGWFTDLLMICRTYTNGAIIVVALLCFHELYPVPYQK